MEQKHVPSPAPDLTREYLLGILDARYKRMAIAPGNGAILGYLRERRDEVADLIRETVRDGSPETANPSAQLLSQLLRRIDGFYLHVITDPCAQAKEAC